MSPQEVIASALTARFRAKNGGTDEIIRSSHRDIASIAVQALLDAGWALLTDGECACTGGRPLIIVCGACRGTQPKSKATSQAGASTGGES